MSTKSSQPNHLIVLVHGLADTLHAWDNCINELRKIEPSDFLLHASAVNGRFKTHDGFDQCGKRLASEIRELVHRQTHLAKLSVIGHSMGGMIARYALGILFNPVDGQVCGLKPIHFITLATPHLGLTVDDGPGQVPFVAWAGNIPLLGPSVKSALQGVGHWVARTVFRGTGRHFLALDGGPGELPLLMLLAMDAPDKDQYFYSALAAFASRACYGNVGRDHWVSWENATIRSTEDLPNIPPDIVRKGRGVIRADPPDVGLGPALLQTYSAVAAVDSAIGAHPLSAAANASGAITREGECSEILQRPVAASIAASSTRARGVPAAGTTGAYAKIEGAESGSEALQSILPSGIAAGQAAEAEALERAVEGAMESPAQVVEFVLERLRRLPWRRVDVSFAGTRLGSAHNNIQATRWTNRVGFSVLEHVRGHLTDVDRLLARSAAGATGREAPTDGSSEMM
ncbi:hypothetical protein VaNZ11_003164 [Volvox africanus]|uniref:DUF676 domain-containing protein n=1 Tax=Volvox africanus TaxID=51714 RepID=A0ABQ5RTJ5_9CHLO|nr:hypothetical protein VaNZ11_003164 [Volvox africanus]